MKITISTANLFEGTESEIVDQIDVAASTEKYIDLVTAALKEEYPDAEIDSADLYHGDRVISEDGEEDFDETQWVKETTGKVYQKFEWVVWVVNK